MDADCIAEKLSILKFCFQPSKMEVVLVLSKEFLDSSEVLIRNIQTIQWIHL